MDRQHPDSFPADAASAPSAPPPGCSIHSHAAAAAFRHVAPPAPIPARPASGGAHEAAPTPNPLKLTAYPITDASEFTLIPAAGRREWMDATDGRFAYRCLPLSMANQAGWWITCPCDFKAHWNGGDKPADTRITFADGKARDSVASHFGTGILTFGLPWLFQTSEGWGLWARGPTNSIKDNCVALDGIIETDWAPYTFTMNWRMMRRGVDVYFRKGEPICQLVPFWLGAFEGVQPQFRQLPEDQRLFQKYVAFRNHKREIRRERALTGQSVFSMDYTKGVVSGTPEKAHEHRTGFGIRPFMGDGDLAPQYRGQ